MNWNNREPISGGAIDSAGPVGVGSWVEFDVSSVVTGDGTYSFASSPPSAMWPATGPARPAPPRPQLVLDGSAVAVAMRGRQLQRHARSGSARWR